MSSDRNFSPYVERNWKIAREPMLRKMGLALLEDYLKLEKLFEGQKQKTHQVRRVVRKERFVLDNIGKQQTKATAKWATIGGAFLSVMLGLFTGDLTFMGVLQGASSGLAAGGLNGVVKWASSYNT